MLTKGEREGRRIRDEESQTVAQFQESFGDVNGKSLSQNIAF